MGKYIDFYLIGELVDSHGNVHYEDLKNLPTVDAVEVVRCKDCVYYENFLCSRFSAYGNSVEEPEYDYCSYGEKK